ncbi:hypothetical protein HDK77DRAFT_428782 [Phyllosticta capitalensis]
MADCDAMELCNYTRANYTNKKFTDLIIRCHDKEFHVHKVIMAAYSGFFSKACDPESPGIEAQTGVINPEDDLPETVQAMLDYCYVGDESAWFATETGCIGELCAEGELRFHVLLHAIADKYQVVDLKAKALERFQWLIECDVLDAHYDGDTTKPISPAGIGRIARDIFDTTTEKDSLRKHFLAQVSLRIDTLLQSSRFVTEVNEIDGFWQQLVEVNVEAGYRARACPSCKVMCQQDFRKTFSSVCDNRECADCGESHYLSRWNYEGPKSEYEIAPDTDTEEGDAAESSTKKRKRDD